LRSFVKSFPTGQTAIRRIVIAIGFGMALSLFIKK
jgi:hypothetical protein